MDAYGIMASNRILKCEIHKNEKFWQYKPHKNEARCMCIKLICQLTPNVHSQLSRCCEQTPAAQMHLLKCVPHELLCCVCQPTHGWPNCTSLNDRTHQQSHFLINYSMQRFACHGLCQSLHCSVVCLTKPVTSKTLH